MIEQEATEVLETVDLTPEILTSGPSELVSSVTFQNLFRHPDAHPIVLDLVLLGTVGPEWMSWDPESIEWFIKEHFKTSLSHTNENKIHAINTLHLVDSFWQRWEVFLWCTMALNGIPPDFQMMQVPTVSQILVSIDIANRIRTDTEWSEEIKNYLQVVFEHDGLFFLLPPADFVKPEPISKGLPIDGEEISKRWPEVRMSKKEPLGETIVDEQLRRLLIANTYLEESRLHLRQQLPLVNHALPK